MSPLSQPLIVFPTEASEIILRTKSAIAKTEKVEDSVVNDVSPINCTFDTVLLPLAHDENERRLEERVLGIFASVSPLPELREASLSAARLFDEANVASFSREDVFRLVDLVMNSKHSLDPECSHYLQRRHQKYLEYGLQVPTAAGQEHLQALRQRIGDLTRTCQKNFNSGSEGIWLKQNRLGGLAEHALSRLVRGNGEHHGDIWYPLKAADVAALLQTVEDSEIRKKVFIAAETKCPENSDLMKELFLARDGLARMLGFTSYASLQLKDNVAKSPGNVESFLADLRQRLEPHAQRQLSKLLDMKNADPAAHDKDCLYYWDFSYYRGLMLKQMHGVNHDELSEYFLFEEVLQGLLQTFERLLNVKVLPVSCDSGNLVWHPDVSILSIWDDDGNNNELLGYVYLDLHPREFKRPKGGHWRLHPGFIRIDGLRHCPSSAIIFNVDKSTQDKPSLMRHAQVISLFHELGHGFRNIVTKTKFAACHGGYDTDFIETPSKLLDHWFWSEEPLQRLARHYSYVSPLYQTLWEEANAKRESPNNRPPERMTQPMITSLLSSRYQYEVVEKLRQVALATFSLNVHNPHTRQELEQMNLAVLYNELRDSHTMLSTGNEKPGHNYTTFSHVFGHWAAAYYSYLHSSAVAADLFRSKEGFNGNPNNKEAGLRWRRVVLQAGGSRPQAGLLAEFLTRAPSNIVFVDELLN